MHLGKQRVVLEAEFGRICGITGLFDAGDGFTTGARRRRRDASPQGTEEALNDLEKGIGTDAVCSVGRVKSGIPLEAGLLNDDLGSSLNERAKPFRVTCRRVMRMSCEKL